MNPPLASQRSPKTCCKAIGKKDGTNLRTRMDKFKFTFVFFTTLGLFLFGRFFAIASGAEPNGWFWLVALTFAFAFGFMASLKPSCNGER